MRVVLDTNVWVSGLLWKGPAWRILRLVEAGSLEICIANAMVLELAEVLDYERFEQRLADLGTTANQLTAYVLGITTAFNVSRGDLPIVVDDPDDDIFLLCASTSGSEFVVSGDRHLLRLSPYLGIPIVTVEDFLDRLPSDLAGRLDESASG